MTARKTDYFGTFLDSYSANTRVQTRVTALGATPTAEPAPEREPPMDAMLKVWPTDPDASMSVVSVAKTFGVSLNTAAAALRGMADVGLVENRGGSFVLTGLGREAATLKK